MIKLGYPHNTCSIGFDLIGERPHNRPQTWTFIWRNLQELLESCVNHGGVGGVATRDGFGFVVLNPWQVGSLHDGHNFSTVQKLNLIKVDMAGTSVSSARRFTLFH